MMIDQGVKMDTSTAVEGPSYKDKKSYPSFYLNKSIPELSGKNVGDTCKLEIDVKIRSKSIREIDVEEKEEVSFYVLRAGYGGDAGKVSKEKYLKMSDDERDEYDKKKVSGEDQDDE